MIKKLYTLLILATLSAPLLAQTVGSDVVCSQERPVASVCPAGRR